MKTVPNLNPNLKAAWVLVAWTLFVWGGRIRNLVTDGDLWVGFGGAVAVGFVLVALATGLVLAFRSPVGSTVAVGLALVSIGWWVIRALVILSRDHDTSFKVVHTALALVTVIVSSFVVQSIWLVRQARTLAPEHVDR